MENIPVLNHRLDESNEIVENVLEMKAKKTPWHLRFAPKAKGIVSFVQNLLSPMTRKEGGRGGQLSAFFQSAAAAVVVGIGLLVGSTGEVQAECDPPIFDLCFHKSSWSSSGYATMWIEFEGDSDELYEVVWHGLKRLFDDSVNAFVLTREDDGREGLSGVGASWSYRSFWWDANASPGWNGYGVSIYEGHWDYDNQTPDGRPTWVRDGLVGTASFNSHQEAAHVYLDASLFPDFDLWIYYLTIDYESPFPNLRRGYAEDYCAWGWRWNRKTRRWEYKNWYHPGDPGSPRFHYGESCSVDIYWPPRNCPQN